VVSGDGRYYSKTAIATIIRMAAANGVGKVPRTQSRPRPHYLPPTAHVPAVRTAPTPPSGASSQRHSARNQPCRPPSLDLVPGQRSQHPCCARLPKPTENAMCLSSYVPALLHRESAWGADW